MNHKKPIVERPPIQGMVKEKNRGTQNEMEIIMQVIKDNPALLQKVLQRLKMHGVVVDREFENRVTAATKNSA